MEDFDCRDLRSNVVRSCRGTCPAGGPEACKLPQSRETAARISAKRAKREAVAAAEATSKTN